MKQVQVYMTGVVSIRMEVPEEVVDAASFYDWLDESTKNWEEFEEAVEDNAQAGDLYGYGVEEVLDIT